MTISEMIAALEKIRDEHGELLVLVSDYDEYEPWEPEIAVLTHKELRDKFNRLPDDLHTDVEKVVLI